MSSGGPDTTLGDREGTMRAEGRNRRHARDARATTGIARAGTARPGTARAVVVIAWAFALVLGASGGAAWAADRYALVVSGASGSPELAEQHAKWRGSLASALAEKLHMPADHLTILSDRGGPTAALADGKLASTRDNLRGILGKLAQSMKKEDVLLVVLLGHSTFDGVDAKFNLVGPDLEAADWQRLVSAIPGRVVFVNTTGASAPFMQRLAGPGRIVITATDSPAQKYETIFPEFFTQAFDVAEADLDKDGRVSVWEAFAFASTNVKQYYRQRGRLSVERPVLDDTGDGQGKDASELGPDGQMASRTFLDDGDEPPVGAGPALSELINRRNILEGEFDELKRRRSFMPPGDYEKQRDLLLIEISRISRLVRAEQRKGS